MAGYRSVRRTTTFILHLPKPPGMEIVERLGDFRLAVHHERAITDDRLIDRLATEQQHAGTFQRFNRYILATPGPAAPGLMARLRAHR